MSTALHSVVNACSHICGSTVRKRHLRHSHSIAAFSMVSADAHRVPLQDLQFEHTALACLPVDENPEREVKGSVPGVCFSLVDAQPLDGPEVVCVSDSVMGLLGAKVDELDPAVPKLLSLSTTFSNCKAYSHCYCGHQFGSFAGMLHL